MYFIILLKYSQTEIYLLLYLRRSPYAGVKSLVHCKRQCQWHCRGNSVANLSRGCFPSGRRQHQSPDASGCLPVREPSLPRRGRKHSQVSFSLHLTQFLSSKTAHWRQNGEVMQYHQFWADMHSNIHHYQMDQLMQWYEHAKAVMDFWPVAY